MVDFDDSGGLKIVGSSVAFGIDEMEYCLERCYMGPINCRIRTFVPGTIYNNCALASICRTHEIDLEPLAGTQKKGILKELPTRQQSYYS